MGGSRGPGMLPFGCANFQQPTQLQFEEPSSEFSHPPHTHDAPRSSSCHPRKRLAWQTISLGLCHTLNLICSIQLFPCWRHTQESTWVVKALQSRAQQTHLGARLLSRSGKKSPLQCLERKGFGSLSEEKHPPGRTAGAEILLPQTGRETGPRTIGPAGVFSDLALLAADSSLAERARLTGCQMEPCTAMPCVGPRGPGVDPHLHRFLAV